MDAPGDEWLVSAQADDQVEKGRGGLGPAAGRGSPSDDLDVLTIRDRQDSTTAPMPGWRPFDAPNARG